MTPWPDLRELEVFLSVVDTGSIGAAARQTGMTQPQASRIVGRLERMVGGNLLQRSTRGSKPTRLGTLFAERCRALSG